MIVWINGALVDETSGGISPFDHGLLTGDGVFETLRVYEGTPFAWRRHFERLALSAEGMGLALPESTWLRNATDEVLAANSLRDARVRITITGGNAPLGSDRGDAKPTVIVAASALPSVAAAIDVVTVPWPRNERSAIAGLKTISYGENVRALAYAHEQGAGEAIFANTIGDLCEGTGTNVFFVADPDGAVTTPPLSSGCLSGVTRALAIECCAELGLECHETDVPLGALASAHEAFLTSTVREIQPIGSVDRHSLPRSPGPVTGQLSRAFATLVKRDLDP